MTNEERKEVFLSCFKCGRIVRSSDLECPRCGLHFGPGTLFECPFCCGLVWRNAAICTTCGTDLSKFSENVERTSSRFDMDEFVDTMINNELTDMKDEDLRVACPGCGLMIKGNEARCPRCDLPLEQALVDCPVCGERVDVSTGSCHNCGAIFGVVSGSAPALETPAPSERPPESSAKTAKATKAAKKAPSRKPVSKKTPAKKGKAKKS